MNKETIEIPLIKATYEELQEVICELQVERVVKDKEIKRLNNIIQEAREIYNNRNSCKLKIQRFMKDKTTADLMYEVLDKGSE